MTGWTDIGALADIPLRGARTVTTTQGCIAVFRTFDDRVFALENRCPHKGGPLAEGIVHGHAVNCPLHNLQINLDSGRALAAEDGAVLTFPVRIEGGRVLLDATRLAARRVA